MPRIHITGASGSGTTTLGTVLAAELGLPHFDSDDYFWLDTPEKYTEQRDRPERNRLLLADLSNNAHWVHSGSIDGWNSGVEDLISLAVFLIVPTTVRIERLAARELAEFGPGILGPGDLRDRYIEFIEWAERYDTAGLEQRSRAGHEAWLDQLNCPVLRIEGDTTTETRVTIVRSSLNTHIE